LTQEDPLSRKALAVHIGRINQSLAQPLPKRWIGFLYRHPKVTLLLMGAFFVLFGFTSVNLFVILKANIDLFLQYGLMVIEDGALQQLVEILGSAYLSIVFYVLFKVCERVLVERLTGKPLSQIKEGAGR
jgi:ABC-type multidrug transport system permease subunit